MKFRIRAIASACVLALCSLTAQAEPAQEFMLENGMKIIVKEDHRAPTAAHMVWYRIGSMDEQNGTTGVAHALEHMMFKGTKSLKPGEFSARVAALGGRENAFTSKDYTGYYQQIEKSRLEAVLALEADRMANLVFDKEEFSREIRAVAERHVGKITPKRIPVTKPQEEPVQEGIRRVTVKAPAENPYVALAFKVPTLRDVEKDDDVHALDVLSAVLDGFDNARRPALFVLDGVPAAGTSTEQLEKLLRAEVQRIAQGGVTEGELRRVKNQLIASQIYKRDSIFGQAMEIGAMEMTGISHRQIDRIIEKLGQVTA